MSTTANDRLDSGRFWIPNRPEIQVGGWFDSAARWPRVVLADPLTPALRRDPAANPAEHEASSMWVSADDDIDPDAFTVHGRLRYGPRRVTLVNATSEGRSMTFGGHGFDAGEQRLSAEYALIGGHVPGASTRFSCARLRVAHLDEWAQLPGTAVEFTDDGSTVRLEVTKPNEDRANVAGLGRLVLGSNVTIPRPTWRGADIVRHAELRLELDNPLTFDEIWHQFVAPIATLISLCTDRDSRIISLGVNTPDGERIQVRHPNIDVAPVDALADNQILFTRHAVTLDIVANWLGLAPRLAPIPAMVAGARTGSEDQSLPSQLLDLTTAVEGLHRRLPEPKGISRSQARAARKAAEAAVDPAMKQRVTEALGHLDEPTYAERLHAVTEPANVAIPEAMGDRQLWETRIKQVRNGFAHQSAKSSSAADEWKEEVVLFRTLRWVLVTALLSRAGVTQEALGERLQTYEPYRYQLRQAHRWTPTVFPSEIS